MQPILPPQLFHDPDDGLIHGGPYERDKRLSLALFLAVEDWRMSQTTLSFFPILLGEDPVWSPCYLPTGDSSALAQFLARTERVC